MSGERRPPSETTAAGYFGGMVDSYDSLIRRAVPSYEEMTARLLDYLPADAARVFESGAADGDRVTAALLRHIYAAINGTAKPNEYR